MCFFCVPDPETTATGTRTRDAHETTEAPPDVPDLLCDLTDHVFTAGIRLSAALEGCADDATTAHLESALDELDHALCDMRTVAFRTHA
jgi:hypothetical protein